MSPFLRVESGLEGRRGEPVDKRGKLSLSLAVLSVPSAWQREALSVSSVPIGSCDSFTEETLVKDVL